MFRVWIMTATLLVVLAAGGNTEEHTYCTNIKPSHYNDVWNKMFPTTFLINYDMEDNKYRFYADETLVTFGFSLSESQADALAGFISKYREWNLKASEKGVTLEKEIGKLSAHYIYWKFGDEWHFSTGEEISVIFFSQSPKKHQLVMRFPNAESQSNEFVTHKGETLYFGWDSALLLGDALSDEYMSKFVAEVKKKQEIATEFQ